MPSVIGPVLLSLLGADLVVHVVDQQGTPVAGVAVSLISETSSLSPHGPHQKILETQPSDDTTGTARFRDVSRLVSPTASGNFVVRLGIPGDDDLEQIVDPVRPGRELRLVLPECGSVLLRTPAPGKCRAQLRLMERGEAYSSHWDELLPPALELVNGVARFERVGLGVQIEYRVTGAGLPTPLQGHLAGPTKAGQALEFAVPGLDQQPTLLARLLDGEQRAIGGTEIDWVVNGMADDAPDSASGRVRTDDQGRVWMTLAGPIAEPAPRLLSLSVPSGVHAEAALEGACAQVALPTQRVAGALDLGELILVRHGDSKRFARLSDELLKIAFDAPRPGRREFRTPEPIFEGEELLLEMIRRGGTTWEQCLAKRWTTGRVSEDPDRWHGVSELGVLTALRRVQAKPDPLALVIAQESALDVMFLDSPWVEFDLRNVDAGQETLRVAPCGDHRLAVFPLCNVEAYAQDGRRLPPRRPRSAGGTGGYSRESLAPGKSIRGRISLGSYVDFPSPGEYTVRLHYHSNSYVAGLADLGGTIVTTSEEFRVHIRPRTVELTRSRLGELHSWIRAIDLRAPVWLVSGHWHERMPFRGEATLPEDKLFRAGWSALPALFEAIEDKSIEPERRAWALGLLWNIVGIENPCDRMHRGALGACVTDSPGSGFPSPLGSAALRVGLASKIRARESHFCAAIRCAEGFRTA